MILGKYSTEQLRFAIGCSCEYHFRTFWGGDIKDRFNPPQVRTIVKKGKIVKQIITPLEAWFEIEDLENPTQVSKLRADEVVSVPALDNMMKSKLFSLVKEDDDYIVRLYAGTTMAYHPGHNAIIRNFNP